MAFMTEQEKHHVILIVDDDAAVVAALARLLDREGYACVGASNLRDAARCMSRSGDDLALVITDLSLAGESGMTLVHHMHRRRPGVPVVVLTAFGDWGTYADALGEGVVGFLNKPVSTQDILALVRRLVTRDPGHRNPSSGADSRPGRGKPESP
jgi:DNA-binding NtrC family response regulator